jgi:uronate dehydrogenase
VLDGARRLDVGRVVYASSNHAVGFTPRVELVPTDVRLRPDTLYGFGKAAAEALCSLYHDRHGLAVACLRIGAFRPRVASCRCGCRPVTPFASSTLLASA